VSSEGVYSSSIEKKRERFLKVADRLLSGRLCIAAMMVSTTKYGLVTAVRFGNKRMAMGSSGQSDTPISEFGLF
jgi:acyl-CoA oxidase